MFDDEIPSKGELLTKIAKFWFDKTKHIIKNHILDDSMLTSVNPEISESCLVVKKCKPIRIEAIVRGYISGSAYNQYVKDGMVSNIKMEDGLKLNDKLETPIFTPSTKAEVGEKDENITFDEMMNIIGEEKASYIKNKSVELYKFAHEYALRKGLCLIDTKFEFGYDIDGDVILIDEILSLIHI